MKAQVVRLEGAQVGLKMVIRFMSSEEIASYKPFLRSHEVAQQRGAPPEIDTDLEYVSDDARLLLALLDQHEKLGVELFDPPRDRSQPSLNVATGPRETHVPPIRTELRF